PATPPPAIYTLSLHDALPIFHYRTPGAPLSEILPLPELTEAAAGLGHAHVELDDDGIARGFFLHLGTGEAMWPALSLALLEQQGDRKSTRLNSSHVKISYAVF